MRVWKHSCVSSTWSHWFNIPCGESDGGRKEPEYSSLWYSLQRLSLKDTGTNRRSWTQHRSVRKTECLSQPQHSPPSLCFCGIWAGVSTPRLCPMIQPPRGLDLSFTQKCPRYTDQWATPPAFVLWNSSSDLLHLRSCSFCSLFLLSCSTPFCSDLSLSLPLAISLRPSLPPGAGLPSLPLSLTLPPWLTAQVSIQWERDACHSREKEEL